MKLGPKQKIIVSGHKDPGDGCLATFDEVVGSRRGGGTSTESRAVARGETVETALQKLIGEVQRSDIDLPDSSYPDVNEGSDLKRAEALLADLPNMAPASKLPRLSEAPDLLQFRSAKMDEGKLAYVTCSKSGGRTPKVSFNFLVEPPYAPYTHTFVLDPDDAIAFGEYLIETAKQDKAKDS